MRRPNIVQILIVLLCWLCAGSALAQRGPRRPLTRRAVAVAAVDDGRGRPPPAAPAPLPGTEQVCRNVDPTTRDCIDASARAAATEEVQRLMANLRREVEGSRAAASAEAPPASAALVAAPTPAVVPAPATRPTPVAAARPPQQRVVCAARDLDCLCRQRGWVMVPAFNGSPRACRPTNIAGTIFGVELVDAKRQIRIGAEAIQIIIDRLFPIALEREFCRTRATNPTLNPPSGATYRCEDVEQRFGDVLRDVHSPSASLAPAP